MKLLSPSCPNRNPLSGFSPPANFGNGFDGTTSPLMNFQAPQIGEQGCDKVHVALGKSVSKAVVLLQWTVQRFRIQEICILHVHQPSPTIPTLLGKLPASRANHEVVSAYRREEREEMKKLLLSYSSICCRLKVQASMITTEADEVQKGIVDLVNKHGIRKLVMEAAPENWMKAKKSSNKASYVAKNAPSSCEVWFVNKGKLVWTREASESSSFVLPNSQPESPAHILRSQSLHHHKSEEVFHPDGLWSSTTRSLSCAGTKNRDQAEAFQREVASSCLTSTSSGCGYSSSAQQMVSSDFGTTVEEESLYNQLAEVKIVAEASRNEVSAQILKRKNLEAKAVDAISKVKALESGHAHEVEHRKEAEDELKSTIQEQERLLEERETITRELLQTMRHIAFLDSRAQEANRRREEASGELKLLQASIATLRQEKQKIQRQKMEATRWLARWRSQGQGPGESCSSGFIGFNEDSTRLVEFSLPDLQTATCDFSESFKIGQGPYGCVYKGEMFDRTVAIKKLHLHNMQGQLKLQQEVQVLGKLKHPHLVDLLGICPESWSLVYEYLPSGSLQDRLFQKSNIHPLNWKIRARIVAEFASALLFLHSSKPEKMVHGDLKPENILLESKLSCKISDFGIRRFLLGETLRCPSFRLYSEPNSAFPYTDPEFHRTGILTCKSDIYSFGLIVLQLLTGKAPAGLAIEVRKAVLWGKLSSILDSSAGEWPTFIASRLVELGLQCCELNSRDRPELTPILVRELEQLHVLDERLVPSFFLCPILQEIMHDPQVAADGFTYEGEALRGWLKNGRETSPMTNLKLSHLNLTPNHALRQAIQDWLCRS